MTRKKYDRDIYDFSSSTESSESDEEEEFDEDKTYEIIDQHWDRWDDIGAWVDSTDIFEYLFLKTPVLKQYHSEHLLMEDEKELHRELHNTVYRMCKALNLPTTMAKITHVVNLILNRRNNFCIIHRDCTHWTKKWSRNLKGIEVV
tara:strand:+ start:3455 stop:3892 length:438 start_codon:yes stop_codon:yes gene_type:complete